MCASTANDCFPLRTAIENLSLLGGRIVHTRPPLLLMKECRRDFRRRSSLLNILPKFIDQIRPALHQFFPLIEICRAVVSAADGVLVLMASEASIRSGSKPCEFRIVLAVARKPWAVTSSFWYPMRRKSELNAFSESHLRLEMSDGNKSPTPSISGQLSLTIFMA